MKRDKNGKISSRKCNEFINGKRYEMTYPVISYWAKKLGFEESYSGCGYGHKLHERGDKYSAAGVYELKGNNERETGFIYICNQYKINVFDACREIKRIIDSGLYEKAPRCCPKTPCCCRTCDGMCCSCVWNTKKGCAK